MGKHRWPISADTRSSTVPAVTDASAPTDDAPRADPRWGDLPRSAGAESPGSTGAGDGSGVGRSVHGRSLDGDTRRPDEHRDERVLAPSVGRGSSSRLQALRSRSASAPLRADSPASSAPYLARSSALHVDAGAAVGAHAFEHHADTPLQADTPLRNDSLEVRDRQEPDDADGGSDGEDDHADGRFDGDGDDDGDVYNDDGNDERDVGGERGYRSLDRHDREDDCGGRRGARSGRRYERRSNRLSDRRGHASQPGIRWGVARSAALVFLGVALAVGAALFLVRSSEPSAAAVSVQLGAGSGSQATSEASAGSEGSDHPASRPGSSPDAEDASSGPVDRAEGTGGGSDVDRGTQADPGTTEAGGTGGDGAGGDGTDTRGAGTIVVYVTGEVASPGVVTMPAGTRLFEILERVGGPLPDADLEGINLAGLPSDGEHLHVLAVGEAPRTRSDVPAAGSSNASTALDEPNGGTGGTAADETAGTHPSAGVIDINTATLAEVEALPRVGPVLGQRIIEWRDTNGPFGRPADIDAVPGIGPALLEGILPLITVR